jgi:membrane-bound serine protease (ClpP class)
MSSWSVPVLGLSLLARAASAAEAPVIRLVEFEGAVHPLSAYRVVQAIDDAEQAGDDLVLIVLDTPGGLVVSMERIVKRMLSSEVPIAVWVGPPGARAASAGFFILIAADVAAMAPGTRTGAAAAVMGGGENREGDVLLKKANEDLAALVRSIALRRGRDVAAVERAVFEAKAYEETVAMELGLADLVAADRGELLARLEGMEIRRFDGDVAVLHTAGASFATSELTLRQQFAGALGHPIVAVLLLLGGLVGIYVELTHPGLILPGLVGATCLVLFALSAQVLPVSAVGLLLILLAVVMFVLEVKVTSYGLLTLAGAVCLALGSWMLIDGPVPELRVPLSVVLPATLTITAFCAAFVHMVARAQRLRVATGIEGLTDQQATVVRALEPEGKVFVQGELWDATSRGGPVPAGARVRVVRVDGLQLTVEPLGVGPANGSRG